jgi:hypothetical protein
VPKVTDTRGKTREVYARLTANGEVPSARQVLRLLGTGSLSTISDELAKLTAASPVEPPASTIREPELEERPPLPIEISRELASLQGELARVTESLTTISSTLEAMSKTSEEQLRIAYERYEAVQRMALQQVDLARQEAREAKARLASLSLDSETREDAMRGKAQHLRDENQKLIGRVEELMSRNRELELREKSR